MSANIPIQNRLSSEAYANLITLRSATKDAVRSLIAGQLGLLVLASFLSLPFIITHISTGRFRQGWRLRKSDNRCEITSFTDARNKSSHAFSAKESSGPGKSKLYLTYTFWYNKLILKSLWGSGSLTVGQLIVILLYSLLVLFAISWNNSQPQNFLKNFRRAGAVAAAQLPMLFILSMKNNLCGLFGVGYERVNFLHRLVGRSVVICATTHMALIMRVQVAPLPKLLTQPTFMYGGIAIFALIVITVTSWGPIRRRLYQCFLVMHILGYTLLLFALWKHVQATHLAIYSCCGCLVIDRLLRLTKTKWTSAHFTSLPGRVTMIEVTRTGTGWRAGQHVFLRVFHAKYMFEKHPFTIANAPATESPYGTNNTLILVAKAHGDYTRRIHRIGLTKAALETEIMKSQAVYNRRTGSERIRDTKSDLEMVDLNYDSQLVVSVEGPYGHTFEDMRTHETVVLVASGVAFTFIMSLFEEIVGSSLRGLSVTKNMLIIWTLRDIDMMEAFISPIQETLRVARAMSISVTLRIHVTSSIGTYIPTPMPELSLIPIRADLEQVVLEAVEITLGEMKATGRPKPGNGIGIAVASGCLSLSNAVKDAALSIDTEDYQGVGGLSVHVENFGSN